MLTDETSNSVVCEHCGCYGPSGVTLLDAAEAAICQRWSFFSTEQPWQFRFTLAFRDPVECCHWLCPECASVELKAEPPVLEIDSYSVELLARRSLCESPEEFRRLVFETLIGRAQGKFPELRQAWAYISRPVPQQLEERR
jgi:hypothetical protein